MNSTGQSRHSDRVAEERRFLDAVCFWRALYALRGPQDRTAVASVSDVIAEATARLEAPTASVSVAA